MWRRHAEVAIEIRAQLIGMPVSEVADIRLGTVENRVIDVDRLDVAPGIEDIHRGLQGVDRTEAPEGVIQGVLAVDVVQKETFGSRWEDRDLLGLRGGERRGQGEQQGKEKKEFWLHLSKKFGF